MAMYRCSQCEAFIDNDYHPCEEGPDRELWCPACYEEYKADQAEFGRIYEEEQRLTALSLQNDPDGEFK